MRVAFVRLLRDGGSVLVTCDQTAVPRMLEVCNNRQVNRTVTIRRLIALIFLAFAAMPFSGMTGVASGSPVMDTMAGMSMDSPASDMDCCPKQTPDPATTCDKSACPTMATCVQQCVPATASAELRVLAGLTREGQGMREPDDLLASLGPEPPPRPPKT
jgi:hypothetical protein